MFEFQFSFNPRIWNMPSLVSRFISGTPFTLQTSTGKTKPKKTYKQNPVFHFSHATETTVVLKNLKNKILLLLCSVLGKIWPNQMYTGLPGQGTWDTVLYCHLVSPARALTRAPAHMLLFIPCPFFFLPVTSCRATAPPCFVPRTEAQTAWFRMPFLFLWSCRVCFSFQAGSACWFCPQNEPQTRVCITKRAPCCTLWETNSQQQQRTGFSEPQSWISHLTPQYPQIFPQRRTSSAAVWNRSFLEVSLYYSCRILLAQKK